MCYQSILKNPSNSKLAELRINIIDKKINIGMFHLKQMIEQKHVKLT